MLMAYYHKGWDRRCPFCFSKKWKILETGIADPKYHHRGHFWGMYKCENCGGVFQDVHNLDTLSELKEKAEAKEAARRELTDEEFPS